MTEQTPPPPSQPTMPPAPRRRPTASRVFAGAVIGCIATFGTIGWFAIGATAQEDNSAPAITDEEFEELLEKDSTINFEHEDGECDLSSIVGDGFEIDDIEWGALDFRLSTTDDTLDVFFDTGNGQFTLECASDE